MRGPPQTWNPDSMAETDPSFAGSPSGARRLPEIIFSSAPPWNLDSVALADPSHAGWPPTPHELLKIFLFVGSAVESGFRGARPLICGVAVRRAQAVRNHLLEQILENFPAKVRADNF